ncbi:uncharacterized protein V6R79_019212 [Siganus canaliculatus]
MSALADDVQNLTVSTVMKTRETDEDSEVATSAMLEPSTLQWPGDRQTRGQTGNVDRMSLRSDLSLREAASWTESERELIAERTGERAGGEGAGLRTHLEEEEPAENHMPEKAAQVFSPAMTVLPSPSPPRDTEAFWEMESEKQPFLGPQGVSQNYNNHGYQYEWPEDTTLACGGSCVSRDTLKMGVSLMTSAIFFPFLVWGGYVFLPFDAPLLSGAPLRLVYTLRCSVFAAVPIVLGWLVLGVCRLRAGVTQPLVNEKAKETELQETTVHRRFVSDSVSLFLVYFLHLVVMAMYLSQEHLKLVPLLTIVFALGRLVYWVAAAFGSSVRGFGFGLSFLPSLAMMVANIYFIFTVEAEGSVFSLPSAQEEAPPVGKQRFYG